MRLLALWKTQIKLLLPPPNVRFKKKFKRISLSIIYFKTVSNSPSIKQEDFIQFPNTETIFNKLRGVLNRRKSCIRVSECKILSNLCNFLRFPNHANNFLCFGFINY